jgi:creatinine amidohydrolase
MIRRRLILGKIKWIETENPEVKFEDTHIGKIKKMVWDADEKQLDKWLKEDFEIPSPSELGKPCCYIQTTPHALAREKRHKNDIVLLPIGCSECHGDGLPTGHDTFQVANYMEGVRRYTAKLGYEVSLTHPILYGGHPHHHLGMAGTIIMPQDILAEQIIAIMLGLWNDGYRKIILVNNHGHMYTLHTAVQEFCKRFQLPGIYQVFDWITACRDFFRPLSGKKDQWEMPFGHAGEAETSLGLLLFPDMIDKKYFTDTAPKILMKDGWFDGSIQDYNRPHQWCDGEGHAAIEISATPEGVIGKQSIADPAKAKRPVVFMCKLLVQLVEDILETYPAGTVPPVKDFSLRTEEELAPYLKEPMSEGWRSVYGISRVGPF